jgi:glucosamine--fructose-6-phosphate aminotransferase (isomerizing)
VAAVLPRTGLWHDLCELPDALTATLEARDGISECAALLGADGVRRIVATGNGAAYYVAVALWLASLESAPGPDVVAVPSGFVARGAFRWRSGDALLAISSSGEFRDLVEAVDTGPPVPIATVTANADSAIASRAGARALVTVMHQRAVTHTQAFCGAVAAALAVWADVTGDRALAESLDRMPQTTAAALDTASGWVADVEGLDAAVAVTFGSGPGWAAALEAALLLKEVAGVPAEGVETREAATSVMMAAGPEHLALSLPTSDDPLLREAEQVFRDRGATVVRAPSPPESDRRLAAITTFPAAAALSGRIGLERGLDVDEPAWTDAYYSVARSKA